MAFIRCDQGSIPADHHTLAMALQPRTGYVHSAYQLTDLDEVAASGEYLRERGYRHATAIKVPVPQPKRDPVRRPDHTAGGQQPGRVMREQLVTGQDVHHQPDGGQQARHSDKRDDQAGDGPQPSSLPVDPARVPGEISTASSASSTTGTTQAGCTRYRPGSATCRPATAMIAVAPAPVLTPFGSRCHPGCGLAGRLPPCGHTP
jgi:hypothetical protein